MFGLNPDKELYWRVVNWIQRNAFGLIADVTIMSKLCWHLTSDESLFATEDTELHRGEMSAVFAVEQIAHGFAAGSVGAFVGLQRVGGVCAGGFFLAAVGTAIGESGLAGFEFEFLSADNASLHGIGHEVMIQG